jgi:hypothetical protein
MNGRGEKGKKICSLTRRYCIAAVRFIGHISDIENPSHMKQNNVSGFFVYKFLVENRK